MTDCNIIDYLRSFRIFGLAIFDWITSLLGAFIIGKYLLKIDETRIWIIYIIFWILFGILIHWYLKIDTMLGYYLGINAKPKIKQC
jgi:hypothetical protein